MEKYKLKIVSVLMRGCVGVFFLRTSGLTDPQTNKSICYFAFLFFIFDLVEKRGRIK
jgi:hypothetical protein